MDAIIFAFFLALLAIYMILAAQFNSFIHPFTIMLSAPLSFIGAFAAIAILGSALDVMGQIAFLMLMGIVMKNGILLVDYINTLRSRGPRLRAAVLEAGPTRMRPVLMTAVSTICGMLPVAFGQGDGSEMRNPMGVIAIGGLATSTLLTLIVVPVAYTLDRRRAECSSPASCGDCRPNRPAPDRRGRDPATEKSAKQEERRPEGPGASGLASSSTNGTRRIWMTA